MKGDGETYGSDVAPDDHEDTQSRSQDEADMVRMGKAQQTKV